MKKILALVLALALVVCASFALAEGAAVMTHEEYIAAELETQATVETYVQATQS